MQNIFNVSNKNQIITGILAILFGMSSIFLLAGKDWLFPLIGLLALSFIFLMIVEPEIRIFILIASMPLTVVSYYIGFTLKLWMIVLFISMYVLVLEIFGNKRELVINRSVLLLLLLFIADAASIINATNTGRSIRILVQYSMLFMLTFYSINYLGSEEKVRRAIRYVLITGTVIAMYGLVQWIGGSYGRDIKLPIERFPQLYSNDVAGGLKMWWVPVNNMLITRIRGPFPDPNIFGGYMLSFVPLLISMMIYSVLKGKHRGIHVLSAIAGVLATFGTVSRTAIVGLTIGAIIVLYYWRKVLLSKKLVKIILVCILMVPIIALLTPTRVRKYLDPNLYLNRIVKTLEVKDESTVLHKEFAVAAIEMWQRHPFMGVGIGNYGAFLNPGTAGNASSHTAVLSFFAETGIIGGLANAAVITMLIFLLIQNLKEVEGYTYWFALNVGLLASYVSTIFGNVTYNYYNEAFVWFIMGLIIAVVRVNRSISLMKQETWR